MSVIRLRYSLAEGSCVILVFLPCIDFILTFLGCIRAGLVAVPVYPPSTAPSFRDHQTPRKSRRTFNCSQASSRTAKPKWRCATSWLCSFSPPQRVHEDQACDGYEGALLRIRRAMAGPGVDQPQPRVGVVLLPRSAFRCVFFCYYLTQTSRLCTSQATISASSNTRRGPHRSPRA